MYMYMYILNICMYIYIYICKYISMQTHPDPPIPQDPFPTSRNAGPREEDDDGRRQKALQEPSPSQGTLGCQPGSKLSFETTQRGQFKVVQTTPNSAREPPKMADGEIEGKWKFSIFAAKPLFARGRAWSCGPSESDPWDPVGYGPSKIHRKTHQTIKMLFQQGNCWTSSSTSKTFGPVSDIIFDEISSWYDNKLFVVALNLMRNTHTLLVKPQLSTSERESQLSRSEPSDTQEPLSAPSGQIYIDTSTTLNSTGVVSCIFTAYAVLRWAGGSGAMVPCWGGWIELEIQKGSSEIGVYSNSLFWLGNWWLTTGRKIGVPLNWQTNPNLADGSSNTRPSQFFQ